MTSRNDEMGCCKLKHRKKISAALFYTTFAAACMAAGLAGASNGDSRRLPIGSRAPLPVAYAVRPARFDWSAVFDTTAAPGTEDTASPATVELLPPQLHQLERLNAAINAARRDEHGARINCVGYVQRKRSALLAAGLPAEALSAAIVMTPDGVSHTVLVVSTGDGDLVLDNLTPGILPWRQTDYVWIEREIVGSAPGSQSRWAWVTPQPTHFAREAATR
jgi:predicted transglutaminase-like cysteine proteinase